MNYIIIISVLILWILIFINNYNNLNLHSILLYIMILISTIIIIISNNLFTIFLSIELQTFCLFILIAMQKNYSLIVSEGALKYFILGTISSSIFLYGWSNLIIGGYENNIYNYTSIIYLSSSTKWTMQLILLSLFFKLTLFPLYFWVADIYEASSYKLIILLISLPKISIFIIVLKLNINTLQSIILIGVFICTLSCINQIKIKRFIAYSSIINISIIYLLLTLNHFEWNMLAFIFLIHYNITIIVILIQIKYYIYISEIPMVWLIYINLLSISGLPPTAGALVKYNIIYTFISSDYIFTAIFISLISILSTLYYLRVALNLRFQKLINPVQFNIIYIIRFFIGFITYINLFLLINPTLLIYILINLI